LALKKDGSLWVWGGNDWGELGLGDTTERLSPTRVGVARDWATVAGSAYHSIALKSDGSLWAWGQNYRGLLGLGDVQDLDAPTRVTGWSPSP
jgi:alpha-tubulin suppressor-like RCC1 family protein